MAKSKEMSKILNYIVEVYLVVVIIYIFAVLKLYLLSD